MTDELSRTCTDLHGLTQTEPKEFVSEGIESLIENEEWEELASLKDRISEVIKQTGR
jgi:hypothetical protein